MKQRIALITTFLLLLFAGWVYSGPSNRVENAPSPLRWNGTGYSIDKPVAIGTTLSAGVPTSQITANTVLTEAQTMGHVYLINAATSPLVKLPTPTSAQGSVVLIDVTTAGHAPGVSPWCNAAIKWGTGSNAKSGTSPFVDAGVTGFTLAFKAIQLPDLSFAWKLLPTDATIKQ